MPGLKVECREAAGSASFTSRMRPVIALLTDFGLRDHYVAAMKGVILRICPEAALVDITHDIPPQDVLAGGLELAACYRYFPEGTVFLAVVDPGVGSVRKPMAASAGGFRFVAPDNGLLTLVLESAPPDRLVQLAEARYALPVVSRTFEGRDRFAPAAAWLAAGVEIDALGPVLPTWERLAVPTASWGDGGIDGEVLRVDRFGNLVTNVGRELLEQASRAGGASLRVLVASRDLGPLSATYADVPPGAACALVGSTGHLEISVNGGSAAERLAIGRGAKVRVSTAEHPRGATREP